MAERVKRWAKRFVNAPEQPIPTVGVRDYIRQYTDQSIKDFVRILLLPRIMGLWRLTS